MTITARNEQTAVGRDRWLSQRTDQPDGNASNIICFPDRRALHRKRQNTELRIFGQRLRKALSKAKDLVLGRTRPAKEIADPRRYGVGSESAATPSVRLRAQG